MDMKNYKSFNVLFVGDYFSLRTSVEVDLDEPDVAGKNEEELMEVAEDLAKNLLELHYGWDMDSLATIDIEVLEG